MKKKNPSRKRHITTAILLLILLVGVGLLVYPTFSDYWNNLHQTRAVVAYSETVAEMDNELYEQMYAEAVAYNAALARTGVCWNMTDEQREVYNATLNMSNSGMMSYIEIPKINCTLPIYHGTDESALQIAIGHLEGTSLPIGGTDTHCVLSGHRGLPSARLFTDLDELVEGDDFLIYTLDEVLTYEVDQIRVVLPTDVSDLTIQKGKDYCTLVTCTPTASIPTGCWCGGTGSTRKPSPMSA
jgi:sortase A